MARKPIRTVFFHSYVGLGGGETSLRGLLGALDRTRHDPVVICPRPGPLTESVRELGLQAQILPYRGASIWFVPELWARFPVVRRMESALTDLSPDVVHADFHALPYVLPASRRLSIPVIFTCYGWWFHPRPWQRNFYRQGPASILAISEAVRRGFLGRRPFMAPERVRRLYLGVDLDVFRPRPEQREAIRMDYQLPIDGLLVTHLARFQGVKGHQPFLAAARQLVSRHPRAYFVMAGENIFGRSEDEALKARILSQARADSALRDRVRFLGWVDDPERLLAASDVVVCSSRYESFGMVLVESMACGTPVVSTNVGGPAEVVLDGDTGYLVPPERPDLLADRVSTLLDDESLRRRMGAAGREHARLRFDLRSYANGFSEVIEAAAKLRKGTETPRPVR